jgi:hypothetical protein
MEENKALVSILVATKYGMEQCALIDMVFRIDRTFIMLRNGIENKCLISRNMLHNIL